MAKTRQSSSFGPVSTYAGRVPFEENDTTKDETSDITLETRVTNLEIAVNQILVTLNDINQTLDNPTQQKPKSQPKQQAKSQPKAKLSDKDKAAQAESEKATQLGCEAVQKVLANGEQLCEADIRERAGLSQSRWLKVMKRLKEDNILMDDQNQDRKARLYSIPSHN
ncbi:hypothetical protein F4212_00320 [Candidatus Poribacteria bacterium]|nr:hypothetical protein [Candidatus Poribacteria bacterium]